MMRNLLMHLVLNQRLTLPQSLLSLLPFSDFTSDTNYYFVSIADRVNKYLAALKVNCLSD